MIRPLCLLIYFLLFSIVVPAHAHDSHEIAALKKQLAIVTERLAALENQSIPAAQPTMSVSSVSNEPRAMVVSDTVAPADPPKGNIEFKGDLRYRHEMIDEDGSPERTRQRVRARLGVAASVSDKAEVGLQIASGSDDPLSTNQTLTDAGSTKDFRLDLAYFTLATTDNSKLVGGKMKNPFHRAGKGGLVWDSDLNPEGLAMHYSDGHFFTNVAGFWLEERSANADALMFGVQSGLNTTLGSDSTVTTGLSYFDYSGTKDRMPLYDGVARGNSVTPFGNYLYDFSLLELFAELNTRLANVPFSVYANWVRNGDAKSEDTAVAYGARFGKASAPGTWEFGYTYRDVEADAVVTAFSDSDFGGGGTRVSGHLLDIGYAFNKRVAAHLTYAISENDVGLASQKDYRRMQADFSLKY